MTCREKLKIEYPEHMNSCYAGGCKFCPYMYGYLDTPEYCNNTSISFNKRCTMCWDREIPENKNNNEMEENKMNETANRTMTREDLYNELNLKRKDIEALKERIEKLAKYEKYDAAAAECAAMKDSFVRAGFTEEQAFEVLLVCLKAQFKI